MSNSDKRFYTSAGGCFFLSETKNGPQIPVGNTPGVEIEVSIEELDHKSAKTGVRLTDDKVLLEKEATVTVTLDEPCVENLGLFFLSNDARTETQAAATGNTVDITISELDATYSVGAKNVTITSIEPQGGGAAFVAGTDYVIDPQIGSKYGRFKVCSGAGISLNDVVTVTYDQAETEIDKMSALNSEQVERYVHFLGNAAKGVDQSFVGKAIITPNGSLSVIQDGEWEQFALDMEFIIASDIANGTAAFEYEGMTVTGRK